MCIILVFKCVSVCMLISVYVFVCQAAPRSSSKCAQFSLFAPKAKCMRLPVCVCGISISAQLLDYVCVCRLAVLSSRCCLYTSA